MLVMGITGPSGAGKGEISGILRERYGFAVIDADKVYHDLVSFPSPCLEEIKAEFGDSVINSDGSLDRRALAKMVLGKENAQRLSALNGITHKYVVCEIKKQITDYKEKDCDCVIDAPLLFEAHLDDECDFTVCVLADRKLRAERISHRDKISVEDALLRISSQNKDEYYSSKSDYIIHNDGSTDQLEADLTRILSDRRVIF
jgi:dephospho-CoA kinase